MKSVVDYSCRFFHIMRIIFYYLLIRSISTIILNINAWAKGVELGKFVSSVGKTYLYRYPGSRVIVGSNCKFLSKSTSNLIGINRECMLSTLTGSAEIIIGKSCGFSGTVIGSFLSVRLGDNVRCGANTLITDSDWHSDDYRSSPSRPVVIENNVWLGESVRVLKGVTIGENTVIGAGSVVTKSIPANVIAAGNPCRVIKQFNEYDSNI